MSSINKRAEQRSAEVISNKKKRLDDENDIPFDDLVKQAKDILKNKIADSHYDFIFTHGENGEYGHDRHVVVHEAIKELRDEGFWGEANIMFFDYKKKKSHFIIKNNFTKDSIKEKINGILKQILKND